MTRDELQAQCERGQAELMRMNYLEAEELLADAEAIAWALKDFDTLSRLYMPLQEARRQIRLRCGEGTVMLDPRGYELNFHGAVDAQGFIDRTPHGQVLVAGYGNIDVAVKVRQLLRQRKQYLEALMAAVYPLPEQAYVVVVPTEDARLPWRDDLPERITIEQLTPLLPPHCLILKMNDLPPGARKGDTETFALVCDLWERLHLPFLREADSAADPVRRIELYRRTIQVDYACELAHQKLSDVARELSRRR